MAGLTVVLDASVAIALTIQEGPREIKTALLDYELIVPGNFRSEIAAVLLRAERRGNLISDEVRRAIEMVNGFPLQLHHPAIATIHALARKHPITACDAAYLATAQETDGLLATLDQTLARAAEAEHRLWKASRAADEGVSFLRDDVAARTAARNLLHAFKEKYGAIGAQEFLELAR